MRLWMTCLGTLFFNACFEPPPSHFESFDGLGYSRFSDFDLPSYVQYFEMRQGEDPNAWDFEHQMLLQFDPQGYGQLDIGQQLDIDFIDTERGFAQGCAPSFCPIYIAAVGESVTVIDTLPLLKNFLGDIDTPAEVALWLVQDALELIESHRYSNGDWIVRVRDQAHRLYELEMTVEGEILEQRLIREYPQDNPLWDIAY